MQKLAIYDILKTITVRVNAITRQISSLFSLPFELYPLVCFISGPSKLNSIQLPALHDVLVCKIHIYISRRFTCQIVGSNPVAVTLTFKSVNIDIIILCKTC